MPALSLHLLLLCLATFPALQSCSGPRSFSGPVPVAPGELLQTSIQGLSCELDDIVWRDSRIGLGLEKRLGELLLATGKIQLIDEEPAIRKARHTALMLAWATKGKVNFDTLPTTSKAQYTVLARILSFGLPARQISLGFAHYSRVRSILRIEVCIRNQTSSHEYCTIGEGYSATEASAATFQIEGNQVLFDRTEAGKASTEALQHAISQLLPAPTSSPIFTSFPAGESP